MALCRAAREALLVRLNPVEAEHLETKRRRSGSKPVVDSEVKATVEELTAPSGFSFTDFKNLSEEALEKTMRGFFKNIEPEPEREIWGLDWCPPPSLPTGIIQPTPKIGQFNFAKHLQNIP